MAIRQMLRFVAMLVALGVPTASFAGQPDCTDKLPPPSADQGVRPIVVLLTSDPWTDVIGSDSPRLALYDDGLIIFRTVGGYRSVRLSRQEVARFRADAGIGALACTLGTYSVTNLTDQPMTYVFLGRGGDLARIGVYGRVDSVAAKTRVPATVRSSYDALRLFDRPDARPWLPDRIEVMLWPYEYAPDPSIGWPAKWPTTRSKGALKRGEGYSIYVPSSDYDELVAFLKTRKTRGAVEVDGRKWAVSIRLPFPQEARWMRQPAG